MQKVEVYLYFPTFYLHIIIKFIKVNIFVTFFIVLFLSVYALRNFKVATTQNRPVYKRD